MAKEIESLVEILEEKNPSEIYTLKGKDDYEKYRLCDFCEGEGHYSVDKDMPAFGIKKGEPYPCHRCGGFGVQYFYLLGYKDNIEQKWGPIPGIAKVDKVFGKEDWKSKKDMLDYQLARYGFSKR